MYILGLYVSNRSPGTTVLQVLKPSFDLIASTFCPCPSTSPNDIDLDPGLKCDAPLPLFDNARTCDVFFGVEGEDTGTDA